MVDGTIIEKPIKKYVPSALVILIEPQCVVVCPDRCKICLPQQDPDRVIRKYRMKNFSQQIRQVYLKDNFLEE